MSLIGFGKSKDDEDRTISADFKNVAIGLFYLARFSNELRELGIPAGLVKLTCSIDLVEIAYYAMMFF